MELQKKDLEKVIKRYGLGELHKFELIQGGSVNYNYAVRTDKGSYVFRLLGYKINKARREHINLQFRVLDYLEKASFPYEVPVPLKNKHGNSLSKLNGNHLWVCKEFKGDIIENLTEQHIKEMAKTLATYHQLTKNMEDLPKYIVSSPKKALEGMLNTYAKLRAINPNNETDMLVKDNLDLFEDCIKKVSNIEVNDNPLLIHGDYHKKNVLFNNSKLTALLDFDKICVVPRIIDLTPFAFECVNEGNLNEKRMELFLKEYEKISPLTNQEKNTIISNMVKSNCNAMPWIYLKMKKNQDRRHLILTNMIKLTKNLRELLK